MQKIPRGFADRSKNERRKGYGSDYSQRSRRQMGRYPPTGAGALQGRENQGRHALGKNLDDPRSRGITRSGKGRGAHSAYAQEEPLP